MKLNKKVLVALSVGAALIMATTASPPKGGKKRAVVQESADDMEVRTFGLAGFLDCDGFMTTNHFVLRPGETSNPLSLEYSTCPPNDRQVYFGYHTETMKSVPLHDEDNVLITVINGDTGEATSALSFLGINGPAPSFVTMTATNQGKRDIKVRLRAHVYFVIE